MAITILLILLIIAGSILLVNKLKKNKTNPTQGDLNRKALKELDSTHGFHYDYSDWIDDILIVGIKSGVKSFNDSEHSGSVIFNNNTSYNFWNANKYYSWLSSGDFTYFDKETNDDVKIEYKDEQPSPEVMLRFKLLLDKVENREKIKGSNAKITRTKREANV